MKRRINAYLMIIPLIILLATGIISVFDALSTDASAAAKGIVDDNTRKIASSAQAKVGAKYVATKAADKGTCDKGCSSLGLVYYAYKQAGIDLPGFSITSLKQTKSSDPKGQSSLKTLTQGDLVFKGNKVGIYLGNSQVIHVSSKKVEVIPLKDVKGSKTKGFNPTSSVRPKQLILKQQAAKHPTSSFTLTIINEKALTPEYAQFIKDTFHTVYPIIRPLWGRSNAPTTITLEMKDLADNGAKAAGGRVYLDVDYMKGFTDKNFTGWFIHELTHELQNYNGSAHQPLWFTEGLAEYVRLTYGTTKMNTGWRGYPAASSVTSDTTYQGSYEISARFLLWLEKRKSGSLLQLHKAVQAGNDFQTKFKEIYGGTHEALGKAYHKSPNL